MRAQQIFRAVGIDSVRNQRGSRGVHPVHHSGNMPGRACQHHTGQSRVIIAAHFTEHIQPVPGFRFIYFQSPADHFRFNFQPFIVDAAAPSNRQLGRQIQKACGDSSRRGCIGDSHLSGLQKIATAVNGFIGHTHTGFQRRNSLLTGHRRPPGKILRTPGNLALPHMGKPVQVKIRPYVHHNDIRTGMTGHHIGACRAPAIPVDHLQGHFLGKGADAVFADTVIPAHEQHHRFQSPDASSVRHHQIIRRQSRQDAKIFARSQSSPFFQHFLTDVFVWQRYI